MKRNDCAPRAIGFGETMIRLSTKNHERFEQARELNIGIGGTESNFLIAFSRLGGESAWISRLTDNFLGRFLINRVKGLGVDVTPVLWTDRDRVGIYYLELGSKPRPSKLVYDRENSAISNINPDEVDWNVLEDYDLLFTTGITAALSDNCRRAVEIALEKSSESGTKVFFDVNYRSKLWSPDEAREVMDSILKKVDILSITEDDAKTIFNLREKPEEIARDLHESYQPEITILSLGSRGALALKEGETYISEPYELEEVDRIGAGDAFDAAFALQYLKRGEVKESLDWGVATAAFAHTIPGDLTYVDRKEIEKILKCKNTGGVSR